MPDIKFATTDVAAMKHGTTTVVKVYQGVTQIWPGGTTTFPTLASSNTEVGTSLGTANAIPAPAGVTAGDLLIVFCSLDAGGLMTASTGWTGIISAQSGTAHGINVFARVADGGANDALALSGSTNDYCAQVHRITGHGVATPGTDIKAAGGATATDAAPNPPSLDAGSSKHWMWFAAVGLDRVVSNTITAVPASYTLVGSVLTSAANTTSSCLAVARRSLQTQTEDPGTFTASTGTSPWCAVTVAIPGT